MVTSGPPAGTASMSAVRLPSAIAPFFTVSDFSALTALTSAPFPNRNSIAFKLPLPAASIKGVRPNLSLSSIDAPFSTSRRIEARSFAIAAATTRLPFRFRPVLQQVPDRGRGAIVGRRQVQRRAPHLGLGVDIGPGSHQQTDLFGFGDRPHQRGRAEIILRVDVRAGGENRPKSFQAAVGGRVMQRRGGVLVLELHALAVHHGVDHRQIVPPDAVIVLVRRIGPLPETGNRQGHPGPQAQSQPA